MRSCQDKCESNWNVSDDREVCRFSRIWKSIDCYVHIRVGYKRWLMVRSTTKLLLHESGADPPPLLFTAMFVCDHSISCAPGGITWCSWALKTRHFTSRTGPSRMAVSAHRMCIDHSSSIWYSSNLFIVHVRREYSYAAMLSIFLLLCYLYWILWTESGNYVICMFSGRRHLMQTSPFPTKSCCPNKSDPSKGSNSGHSWIARVFIEGSGLILT